MCRNERRLGIALKSALLALGLAGLASSGARADEEPAPKKPAAKTAPAAKRAVTKASKGAKPATPKAVPAFENGIDLAQATPPPPKKNGTAPTTKNGKVDKSQAAAPKDAKAATAPAAPAAGQGAPGQPAGQPAGPPAAAGAQPAPAGQAAGAGAQAPGGAAAGPADETTIMPEPGMKGRKVYITKGEIPVLDFVKFLSDFTGLPLLHETKDPNLVETNTIKIANDIPEADEDLVKAILEVNKFRVFRETLLPSGREVLKVESITPTPQAGVEDPKDSPLINIGPDGKPTVTPTDTRVSFEQIGVGPDEFATMIFTLKYTAPRDASEALISLVGGGGRPTGAPGGAGALVRGTKTFSMVEVKNTMMLIITAKFGLLNYIKKLLELIDVPVKEPERIIHIIEVQEADAEEMKGVVDEFLQGQGGRFGAAGGRRLGSRTGIGQPTPTPTPGVPGALTGTGTQTEYRTNLIADYRTNKIIVETYSEQDLNDILMLIHELDVRFDLRRLKTHIYRVRYLKAVEVASDLQSLLQGAGGAGLSGLRRGAGGATGARTGAGAGRFTARRSTARTGALPTGGPGAAGAPGAGGQNAPIPSLIVPHEPTNSLMIQAEPEEYDEILNILSKIDTKRRQVFLEAALVQVQSQSSLNYTIELLAGNPDDAATRGLFASSFNLTGIDFENFQRVIPDISDPASVPPGGIAAIMHRGKLPAIIQFFKSNRDSQILATPFVLADDNMQNAIEILEMRYVVNTATVNTATTSSQQSEPAGITLAITPTISGSERAVFMELELTVSEFQEATAAGQGAALPPKNENKMTSAVTIPDGDIFVVGGLTRQNKSKSVSKVPILGDIPLVGKLFRSESTVQNQNNLYVFLQAHILTDEEFDDGLDLTGQAERKMHKFDPSIKPAQFEKPDIPEEPAQVDEGGPRTSYLNPSRAGDPYLGTSGSRYSRGRAGTRGATRENLNEPGYTEDDDGFLKSPRARAPAAPAATAPASPAKPPARSKTASGAPSAPKRPASPEYDGWLLPPEGGAAANGQDRLED